MERSTLRGQKEKRIVLFVSLELTLGLVRGENASLSVAWNENMVRASSLQKKVVTDELNRMDLLQERKQSKEKVKRIKCEIKLLRQTTEGYMTALLRKLVLLPGM